MLTRETKRKIKNFNSVQLEEWINSFGQEMYNMGANDASVSVILALHDEFAFGQARINRAIKRQQNTMQAISKKLISTADIVSGLQEEKIYIKV